MPTRWLVVFTDGSQTTFEAFGHAAFLTELTRLEQSRPQWGEIRCILRLS